MVDAGRILVFHVGAGIAIARHTDLAANWLVVPVVFGWCASVRFFAQIVADQLVRPAAACRSRSSWVQWLADPGVLHATVLLWSWPGAFMAAYSGLAAASIILVTATLLRTHRRLTTP